MYLLLLAKLLLCFQLFALGNCQQCMKVFKASNPKIPQLETGHFSIEPSTPVDRYSWHRVTLTEEHNSSRLSVALSIVYISEYCDQRGVDFSVRAIPKATFFDAVFTISSTATWVKAHFHYMASSREDLRCGSFVGAETALLEPSPGTSPRKIRLMTAVTNPQWQNTRVKVIPYVYISGIRSEDMNLRVKLSQAQCNFVNQTLAVTLLISNNTKPIQMLQLSFFAYAVTGKVVIRLTGASSYWAATLNNQTQGQYGINGITVIYGPAAQAQLRAQNSSRLLTQLSINNKYGAQDLNLPASSMNLFKRAFEIEQLNILSNQFLQPILRRAAVNPVVKKMADGNICINYDSCNENGGAIVEVRDNKLGCAMCAENKTYSTQTEQCECLEGYLPAGDQCLLVSDFCGSDQLFKKGVCFQLVKTRNLCQKNQVYEQNKNRCVCGNGFKQLTTITGDKFCSLECPSGLAPNYQKLTCECPKGTYLRQGRCIRCNSALQQWNQSLGSCVCRSFTMIGSRGECLLCSPFARANSNQTACECLTGYVGNGVICREVPKPSRSGISLAAGLGS